MSRSSKRSFWIGCVLLVLTSGCNHDRTVEVEIINAAPYKVSYQVYYPSENGSDTKAGTLRAGGIEKFKTTFEDIKPSFTISVKSANEEKDFLRWHFGLSDSDSVTRKLTLDPLNHILPTDTNKSVFRHVITDGAFPSIYIFGTNWSKSDSISRILINAKNKPYTCASNAMVLNKKLNEKFKNKASFKVLDFLNPK